MSTSHVMDGAEPWSHHGTLDAGVLVVHGFTGNPGSMRGLAEACAAAGFHVEMPLLAGHGTVVEDMVPTGWEDWSRDADAAYRSLAERVDKIVVMGLSMGGSITLWLAAQHPGTVGIVCVNPATFPIADEMLAAIRGLLDEGTEIIPGIGSDIADPETKENAYPGTPIRPLLSFMDDGLRPLSVRYGDVSVPLLLFTSENDHVVEPAQSDQLVAAYGGPVERVMLKRSFHVATQDYDKELIFDGAVAFARRLTGH
jgi:carboxylesterase